VTLAGLAVRNVLRNKFRAVLTMVGVAMSILTFLLLRTVVSAWSAAADFAAKDRLVTRHKVTFVMTLPLHYATTVRGMTSDVRVATYANWFGGKDPQHENEFFGSLAADTETFFQVYDDMLVAPDAFERWKQDPQGAIVGDVLAKKMGWKVGDRVTLATTIGIYAKEGDWPFRISGIYEAKSKAVDRSTFVFHWKYLNDGIPTDQRDQIGWVVSRVVDRSRVAAVGLAVDRAFDEREVQTLSQDEGTFNASFLGAFSAVLKALDVVAIVILLILTLVLGNTIAMGVRERTQEYGVLKALGFSSGHVRLFIVTEAVVLGLGGGLLGLAIGYPIIEKGIGRWLEENMGAWFPYFRVPPVWAGIALLLALVLATLGAVIPAILASRLRAVDALKRIA
jgi:putative ABC transport system permease protein